MFQEIKEKLKDSKELTVKNKTQKVNNKQITEKEICQFYSDIIFIEII